MRLPRIHHVLLAAVLAGSSFGYAEEPCKNHFILRCPEATLVLEWSTLPAPILDHGTGATATLLADGRVLLAGGADAGNRAEVFDPHSETWTLTQPMAMTRAFHRAVRLLDGRVLVVGGNPGTYPYDGIPMAELFDPATGSWSSTPRLLFLRLNWKADHTLTLLHDGNVLLTGGSDLGWNGERRAELFDPARGTWEPAGALASYRVGHTATLLPDGKVLVAGGITDWEMWVYTPGAELYDPATRSWTLLQGPAIVNHTATPLADGRVLVAGGQTPASASDPKAPRGFMWPQETVAKTWLFDPATGRWRETRRLNDERHDHLAIPMPNGDVFATGGRRSSMAYSYFDPDSTAVTVAENERFDATSETWQRVRQVGPLLEMAETGTPLLDGSMLVTASHAAARLTFRNVQGFEPPKIAR